LIDCFVFGSFYDLVMEMIADRSSAVLDVESDVRLCSIKVCVLEYHFAYMSRDIWSCYLSDHIYLYEC